MSSKQKRLLIVGGLLAGLLLIFLLANRYSASGPEQPAAPAPEQIGKVGMITYYQMEMADGTSLAYGVVHPDETNTAQTRPVLLALPPGPQNEDMVVAGISGYWGEEALNRGWVVVSPIAPNGSLFFQGSEQYLPAFLDRIEQLYPPAGGKFHLAGISNGGISAFRIGTLEPERFHNLVAVPGLAHTEDFERLDRLGDVPVTMFVGAGDTGWIGPMEEAAARLTELGSEVSLTIVPNEGHVIQSLSGGVELFDIMAASQ